MFESSVWILVAIGACLTSWALWSWSNHRREEGRATEQHRWNLKRQKLECRWLRCRIAEEQREVE